MKIKKALAYILAVAMVISLMPAMAFASTENTVSSVIKVEADDTFTSYLNLKVTSVDPVQGSFDIELNNAEWDVTGGADTAVADAATVAAVSGSTTAVAISYTTTGALANLTTGGISVETTSVTENTMRVKIGGTDVAKDQVLRLALNLKAKDEASDVTVTIADSDAKVSNGTYTVATVGNGGTVASVIGSTVKKVSADGTYTGNTVKLSEVASTSVKATKVQGMRLTLPKNYNWVTNATSIAAMFSGDMLKVSPATATLVAIAPTTTSDAIISAGAIGYKVSDNKLDVYFVAAGTGSTELLQIAPTFTVDAEASTGDVTLTISNLSGDISAADDLVIAQNVIESVEVKTIKTIPELLSGRMYEKDKEDSQKYQYVYVTLKENVAGAITDGKSVKFELPEEVQIATTDAITYTKTKDATKDSSYSYSATTSTLKNTYEKNANSFTWTSISEAGKSEYTFKIPVLVEAGYTGDIDVTVSGAKAGIEEQTVTVATAVSPIEVEAVATDIKAGIQNQVIGDIVIKETAKGMLIEGKSVELNIADLLGATFKDTNATIKVEDGDIEVNTFKVSSGGNDVSFNIKSKSTKASTIRISGVTLSTTRTPAEGGYDLKVAGDAVVTYANPAPANNYTPNNDNFKSYAAKVASYVNVVTPADSVTVSEKVDAQFVIGEASYTNNGAATEMDAAAYIDSHNRTMVPIRYVANACGISENDIRWEQNTQTAIINGLNTVVTVKMGSNKLQTSTGEITMDTVAVNNNGRIYVPVRYIANALGANVSWDAATKTVTLTK